MYRLFILFTFLFISCGENTPGVNTTTTTQVSTTESDTDGDLFIYAVDAVSGNLIPDATYQLASINDSSVQTYGTNGVTFQNLPVGDHYAVLVSAEHYAPMICNAAIQFADNVNSPNMAFVENTSLEVQLRKLSASLKGSLFYQNASNPLQLEVFPAAGAQVSIVIQDEKECAYSEKTFGPVTVNADGFYSFDSLPEMANYNLIVHDAPFQGLPYSGKQTSGSLGVSGNAVILQRFIYDEIQTAFGFVFVSDNRSMAEKTDTLKFGFSEPANVSLLRNSDLSVTNTNGGSLVAVNYFWADSNKTFMIAPAFGVWESGATYAISMKLYSAISS